MSKLDNLKRNLSLQYWTFKAVSNSKTTTYVGIYQCCSNLTPMSVFEKIKDVAKGEGYENAAILELNKI